MKILIVSEPGVNGVFRHVERLVDYLISMGHQVSLAYSDVRDSDRLGQMVNQVRQAGGLAVNLRVGNQPQLADLAATQKLWRLYRQVRPDVIHAHSAKAGGLTRGLRLLGSRTPVFYTPHAYYGMGKAKTWSTRFYNRVERLLASRAVTINVSDDEAKFARRELRVAYSKQLLIRNGVDTAHFAPVSSAERLELRRRLGIPAGAVVLGSLGRFSYQKDPATLHHAFRACAERMPNLWMVHIGAGELRAPLQRYAVDHGYDQRTKWIEYMNDPAPFYQVIDGFALTSRYEGLSLALLEALSADLPLILSDAPGNNGFADLGLSHLWMGRVESAESFAVAIACWYEDRQQNRFSNHRRRALELFSEQAQLEALDQAYRQAAGCQVIHREMAPTVSLH